MDFGTAEATPDSEDKARAFAVAALAREHAESALAHLGGAEEAPSTAAHLIAGAAGGYRTTETLRGSSAPVGGALDRAA